MKHLILAAPRGFCAGVIRAIRAVEIAMNRLKSPVYVKHAIVHNNHVIERLEKKGAIFVEEIDEIPENSTVIFSAHGVSKKVVEQAKAKNLNIIDATCPLVTKIHLEAVSFNKQNLHVILIGHAGHVEVAGSIGQLKKGSISLIQNEEEAASFNPPSQNLAYITQTTLSVDETSKIIQILKDRFPNIKEPRRKDICYATTNRQLSVKEIAKIVQIGLVLGAHHSSNSMRLKETFIRAGCKQAFLLEDYSQVPWDMLEEYQTIGITASASAPEYLVEELIQAFQSQYKDVLVEEFAGVKENISFSLPPQLR